MNTYDSLNIDFGRAICYSGFRENQYPGVKYPTYEQIKEDLFILRDGGWKYLRLFDVDLHAKRVIDVIKKEKLDFKLMLSAYVGAEMNNFNCPWGGGVYSEEQLVRNAFENQVKIMRLIDWAKAYPDIIFIVSVGNEACVDWTDHYVPVAKVVHYVQRVQKQIKQPVTFCENYAPWLFKLDKLAKAVDVISIHTYPVWEYKNIEDSLNYTKDNYYAVTDKHPDKTVIITEAGWATQSNGRGIDPKNVSEEYQKIYFEKLMEWVEEEKILTFFFEAFDEPWKGSPDPFEPEKHWGLYKIDRTPKLAMKKIKK